MQQCSKNGKMKHVHYLRSLNSKLCNITKTKKKLIDNVLFANDVNMNMMMRNSVLIIIAFKIKKTKNIITHKGKQFY